MFSSNPRSGGRYAQNTSRPDGRAGLPSTSRGSYSDDTFIDPSRFQCEPCDEKPVCHRFLIHGEGRFGNQCHFVHAWSDIFQFEKRPFDVLDMVPDFSGRRSSAGQDNAPRLAATIFNDCTKKRCILRRG